MRVGMTKEQVLSLRGKPVRRESIPSDAELWYYPDGEVAFSFDRVSYVELGKPSIQSAPVEPTPKEQRVPEVQRATQPSAQRAFATATVHTPGDGFLALRSEPTIRSGKRLVKIPHGARLTLGECVTRPGEGRWCRTGFQGREGWVAERYLVR